MLADNLQPKKITDILDNIEIYLEEMRKKNDKVEIPKLLNEYIWEYFRNVKLDEKMLKSIGIFVVDHTYRYAASSNITDAYTHIYFSSVIAKLWDTLQDRGIDIFYILDNQLRNDRFMLTVQLFALSGIAVVAPYAIKDKYLSYMSLEEQGMWALSFKGSDFDPNVSTMTLTSSNDDSEGQVLELVKKYMDHTRNIVYIEKDDSVNYLEQVKVLAENSKYLSIFRNNAPENPNVIILN